MLPQLDRAHSAVTASSPQALWKPLPTTTDGFSAALPARRARSAGQVAAAWVESAMAATAAPTVVLFDRDNTLVYYDPEALASLERRVAAVAPQLPPAAAARHWRGAQHRWPQTVAEEPAFWTQFWGSLAGSYGLSEAQTAALSQIGDIYHTCYGTFPDVQPCLGALHAAGVRMAVFTNFELPSIERALAHAGIEPAWFDGLWSSAALGVRKPNPAAYVAVAARLGAEPQDCLVVDDEPQNLEGAAAAGMQVLLIDRAGAHMGYPRRIATLEALADGPWLVRERAVGRPT
jgi:HAD superfamily hydrolase (TIGR01509 family)